MPGGWGEEFNDKPRQRVENLSGQHLSKFNDQKQLDKKETCTVRVWKDEVIKIVIEEMQK